MFGGPLAAGLGTGERAGEGDLSARRGAVLRISVGELLPGEHLIVADAIKVKAVTVHPLC